MRKLLACLTAATLCACGAASSGGDAGSGDSGTFIDAGQEAFDGSIPDAGPLVGSFSVSVVVLSTSSDRYTQVIGKVYDAPALSAIVWEKQLEAGQCRLVTPRVPFCATPCGGAAVCVENDTCKPYPASKPVGTVTATGVRLLDGGSTFSMDPVVNSYQPLEDLAVPPFAEGDVVKFSATGSTFTPAFTLQSRGIALLTLSNAALELDATKPLQLAWAAPGAKGAGVSNVHVKLDISHHGGTKGMIECDAPDTGSLTISTELVAKLLSLGVAGFPTVIVTRAVTGAAAISAGRVELTVSSEVERSVTIQGVESCHDTSECTGGKTCKPDLTCS